MVAKNKYEVNDCDICVLCVQVRDLKAKLAEIEDNQAKKTKAGLQALEAKNAALEEQVARLNIFELSKDSPSFGLVIRQPNCSYQF